MKNQREEDTDIGGPQPKPPSRPFGTLKTFLGTYLSVENADIDVRKVNRQETRLSDDRVRHVQGIQQQPIRKSGDSQHRPYWCQTAPPTVLLPFAPHSNPSFVRRCHLPPRLIQRSSASVGHPHSTRTHRSPSPIMLCTTSRRRPRQRP
jgi:hypothetical protein